MIDEPHVHPLLRANIWHVRGRHRDLVVDTGLGVGCLGRELPMLFERDPLVVLTHHHLDHTGGAHEFHRVCAHPAIPITNPLRGSLRRARLLAELGLADDETAAAIPELLISAAPSPDYDPDRYRLRPPRETVPVVNDDILELGDRSLHVLHLPGHTPDTIGLYSEQDGLFFSGDFIYDDVLIDNGTGSDIGAYTASMRRIQELPITTVLPGHGKPIDAHRLQTLIDRYLAQRTTTRA